MVKVKKELPAEEKILEAARRVFLRKGMAGARMQDIADEAGINKALLHYYYRDKDKLFNVIFRQEAEKFFPRINTIFESKQPLFEKITEFAQAYIDEMKANPYLPWFVMNEINRDPEGFLQAVWGKENLPKPQLFLAQVETEIRAGHIRPIAPIQLLLNLLSLCIFPFIARPMLQLNLGISDTAFNRLLEERKKEIPQFFINALKP